MKILPQSYSPSFKSHFYDVDTKDDNAITIKTDNTPYLGEDPYLVKNGWEDYPMIKEGDFYSHYETFAESQSVINYIIHFLDTDNKDTKNNEQYSLDAGKLARKATIYDKKAHKQPLINFIGKGKVKGKSIVSDDWNEITKTAETSNVPLIVMTKDVRHFDPYKAPKNIQGLILTASAMNVLSHEGARLRHRTKTTVMLYDDDIISKLQKFNNKFISLDTTHNSINYKEINENSVGEIKDKTFSFEIPKMIPTNRMLTTDEYSTDNVGAKAYNLKRLKEMTDDGKLEDIKIPANFVIPNAFFKNILSRSPIWRDNQDLYEDLIKLENMSFKNCSTIKYFVEKAVELDPEQSISDVMEMCQKVIPTNKVMVRSAFNDEDIEHHSAAGIYDSYKSSVNEKDLLKNIIKVAASKWNYKAYQSRLENNIDVNNIDGSIIVQEFVPADYIFNIYTNTSNNVLRIEMKSKEAYQNELNDPYVFSYDKNTDTLTFDSIERKGRKIHYNENLEIIGEDKIEDDITVNFEKYKHTLKKLAKNALKIEKEFGKPQDIEGGLLGDQIYLWQSRNIVY